MKHSDSDLIFFHTENKPLCEDSYGEEVVKDFLIIKSERFQYTQIQLKDLEEGEIIEADVITIKITNNTDDNEDSAIFTLNDIQIAQLIGFLQSHL